MTAGIVSAEPVWSDALSSAAVPVGGGSGRRCILAGDRPRRRSLACSLHRGFGESALLCLLDARLVRVGEDGGGDGAVVGGGPGSLRARRSGNGGWTGSLALGFGDNRRFLVLGVSVLDLI